MALILTDDERMLLASLPHEIGSAVAFAGRSGLFGTGKELFTGAQAVLAGARDYPNNELIQAIVPDPKAADRSAEMAEAVKVRDWGTARIKARGVASPEAFTALALEDCKAASALLARLDATQAAEYRRWAMSVADSVAQASTEGGFLGFGGERLSAAEKKLIGEIQAALA
jgi:hypothetical protein